MVYGGMQLERIALSESTAWSGAPMPAAPPVTTATDPGVKEKCAINDLSVRCKPDASEMLLIKNVNYRLEFPLTPMP